MRGEANGARRLYAAIGALLGVALWMAFPVAYCAYALLRGAQSGLYPYPFLEADELGYARVAGNVAILVALFVLLGLALTGFGRALARRQAAASAA